MHPANPPKSEDKYVEKVFNWSEFHSSEMTCYKIHTLSKKINPNAEKVEQTPEQKAKLKEEKKKLREERRKKDKETGVFDIGVRAKQVWEEVRREDCAAGKN